MFLATQKYTTMPTFKFNAVTSSKIHTESGLICKVFVVLDLILLVGDAAPDSGKLVGSEFAFLKRGKKYMPSW